MHKPVAVVIEDSEDKAQIFASAVEDANYESTILRDGRLAIGYLEESVPDLVVLDLRLPKVAGVHVLKAIRDDERMANTRIIVVNGDATQTEYVREAVDLVLVKPIGYKQLREMAP